MKSNYLFLIVSIIAIVTQCNDTNKSKPLAIVEIFNALVSKPTLTKAEQKKRTAIKKELSSLSNQIYISDENRSQITTALQEDSHKTPEHSPAKSLPVIAHIKKQAPQKTTDLAKENIKGQENVRFGYVDILDFNKDTTPHSMQLDVIFNTLDHWVYQSSKKELAQRAKQRKSIKKK